MALVLALIYLGFEGEIFEEEYEANHPAKPEKCSLSSPSTSWESLDKEDAPPPFFFNATPCIELLFIVFTPQPVVGIVEAPFDVIRDKSPPSFSL